MSNAPSWARGVGIVQISLGAFGIFFQIYKLVIPAFSKFQNIATHAMNENMDLETKRVLGIVSKEFGLTNAQANIMITLGFIGILLCVFYIIGGVKMLKLHPKNLRFGQLTLLLFIIYNMASVVYFTLNINNILVMGLSIYMIGAIIIDIALLIIIIASDKSDYGLKGKTSPTSRKRNSDERYLTDEEVY